MFTKAVFMKDAMSPDRATDKEETLLLYPSPSPLLLILILPAASYF